MVAHAGRPLDMFNDAYNARNLESARSALKSIDFPYADAEVCTQLKDKYSRLLIEIVSYPSLVDLDIKMNFLAMFFLSQIPVMMRKSFAYELQSNVAKIDKRIREIETPLPQEQYRTRRTEIYNALEAVSGERLNADNYQIIMAARRHPTFEHEVEETHIDQAKLDKRLNGDPEHANRMDIKARLSAVFERAFPDRIISSDFDDPRNILKVLCRERKSINILELNGSGLNEDILIKIIRRINQTSLTTLRLSNIAWTGSIANYLADTLRSGARIITLDIGTLTEHIEPEISKLLLSALVENDSILNIPDSTFSDSSQSETLPQIRERNHALHCIRQGQYPKDRAAKIFFEWGTQFARGAPNVSQSNIQHLKWYVEAAKLNHIQAIISVTLCWVGNNFNPNTIKEKLASHSLSLPQLQQWIDKLLMEVRLSFKERQILVYNLGQLYEHKMIGLPNDGDKKAVEFYRATAELRDGHPGLLAAQMALARMSEQGRGITEKTDRKKQARYWYNQAALQGDEQAAIEVQRLEKELGWTSRNFVKK